MTAPSWTCERCGPVPPEDVDLRRTPRRGEAYYVCRRCGALAHTLTPAGLAAYRSWMRESARQWREARAVQPVQQRLFPVERT